MNIRIDDLQKEAVRTARYGLRRLGDCARIAYALTATEKPGILDALLWWQALANSREYTDKFAKELWDEWVVKKLGGPQPIQLSADDSRTERKKKEQASRSKLRPVAEQLSDPNGNDNLQLHNLWKQRWEDRQKEWKQHLRKLRKLILPRIGKRPSGKKADAFQEWKAKQKSIRGMGGLSVQRLRTIRGLYQLQKSFRMRPEPDDLRKNVPELGDDSLAKFGHRILNQLERLREQRIKQLASRIVEAALGVGSEDRSNHWDGHRRAKRPIEKKMGDHRFAPCHVVIGEDLERYRPEENRLRRENRQLMDWAARNVRKYISENSQLHGLHFDEVSPAYTSRQDSRTGSPGMRCEEFPVDEFIEAVKRLPLNSKDSTVSNTSSSQIDSTPRARRIKRLQRMIGDALAKSASERDSRMDLIVKLLNLIQTDRKSPRRVCLPRRGGELFLSVADLESSTCGLQADLNAAANIGLKALSEPDWLGAWWFILVDRTSGQPNPEKIKGCHLWSGENPEPLLSTQTDGKRIWSVDRWIHRRCRQPRVRRW